MTKCWFYASSMLILGNKCLRCSGFWVRASPLKTLSFKSRLKHHEENQCTSKACGNTSIPATLLGAVQDVRTDKGIAILTTKFVP